MSRFALAVLALAAAFAAGDAGATATKGGTFHVVTWPESLQSIDPAFLGGTPVPEAATGYPRRSHDRRTYTFTIRRGLRFASGAPLTARNFEYGINRGLNPKLHPDDAEAVASSQFGEIVGARAVLAGEG